MMLSKRVRIPKGNKNSLVFLYGVSILVYDMECTCTIG